MVIFLRISWLIIACYIDFIIGNYCIECKQFRSTFKNKRIQKWPPRSLLTPALARPKVAVIPWRMLMLFSTISWRLRTLVLRRFLVKESRIMVFMMDTEEYVFLLLAIPHIPSFQRSSFEMLWNLLVVALVGVWHNHTRKSPFVGLPCSSTALYCALVLTVFSTL